MSRRRAVARRLVGAAAAAAIVLGGLATAAPAATGTGTGTAGTGPAPPRSAARPPVDNVFPVPLPYEVSYSDSWGACRDGCSRSHRGNDLMADEGVPLVAVESGVIVRASPVERGLGGVTLWLRGDSGVAYYYAHNTQNLVAEGQRVARGEVVARVGRTGNARRTAPHVHFQVNLCGETSSTVPCTVDPHPYLRTWAQAHVGGGVDGVAVYDPATATFSQSNESGSPLAVLRFGAPGVDVAPIAGDWDGDGRDSVGVHSRVGGVFSLRDDEGAALPPLPFGEPGRGDAWPIAGDFDGDGRDTVGLYLRAEAAFVVRVEGGKASAPVALGVPGATDGLPVAGDWDGDGRDGLGVYRQGDGIIDRVDDDGLPLPPSRLAAGPALFPVAGDWDGDGREEVGLLRRDAATVGLPVPTPGDPAAVRTVPVAAGAATLPVAGDWNGADLVTRDELRHVFGSLADDPKVVAGLPGLNAAMARAGISTPARKAAFLATVRNESALRYDAVEAGTGRYRGRGLIQLTGEGNYERAGDFLQVDLVGEPDLAIHPLASPAVAAWYWTVARNVNVSADALDMAAVNIAIGFAPSVRRDMLRCGDFLAALRYYSGGEVPPGVNCERTAASRARAFSSILPSPLRPGREAPAGTVVLPGRSIPSGWVPATPPSVAPGDPGPSRPPSTPTRPTVRPPAATTPTTRPTTSPVPTTPSPPTSPPTSAAPPPTATTVPPTATPDTTVPPTTPDIAIPPTTQAPPTTAAPAPPDTTVGDSAAATTLFDPAGG